MAAKCCCLRPPLPWSLISFRTGPDFATWACIASRIGRPERLFQLVHPDLADGFPPLTTLDRRPNNLPTQTSTFVGRDAGLEAGRHRWRSSQSGCASNTSCSCSTTSSR